MRKGRLNWMIIAISGLCFLTGSVFIQRAATEEIIRVSGPESVGITLGINMAEKDNLGNPIWGDPISLPEPVNLSGWEDSVFISPDEKKLYFVYITADALTFNTLLYQKLQEFKNQYGRDPTLEEANQLIMSSLQQCRIGPDRPGNHGEFDLDIYEATKLDDGNWAVINSTVNQGNGFLSLYNEASPVVTSDGKTMYLAMQTQKDYIGHPDIQISTKDETGKWTTPEPLSSTINTEDYPEDNPHISADGNTLYFDSDRPGGLGGRDIWVSRKTNGAWTEPTLLSGPVNTPETEWQAFVTADGKTMYFSADGPGYYSRFGVVGNAIYKWEIGSEKINLVAYGSGGIVGVGEPSLTADGKYLYFLYAFKRADGLYESNIAVSERIPPKDTTAPTTPGSPYISRGTNPNNTGTFTLGWVASTDADSGLMGYQIVRQEAATYFSETIATNTYQESNLAQGRYSYVVSAIDKVGNVSVSSPSSVAIVVDKTPPAITNISDSPDPFYARKGQVAKISYTLGDNLSASLTVYTYIYTSGGTLVKTLGPYTQNLGANSVTWNGKNSSGVYVKDGTYKYRLKATDSAGNVNYSGYYYVTKR